MAVRGAVGRGLPGAGASSHDLPHDSRAVLGRWRRRHVENLTYIPGCRLQLGSGTGASGSVLLRAHSLALHLLPRLLHHTQQHVPVGRLSPCKLLFNV